MRNRREAVADDTSRRAFALEDCRTVDSLYSRLLGRKDADETAQWHFCSSMVETFAVSVVVLCCHLGETRPALTRRSIRHHALEIVLLHDSDEKTVSRCRK